MIETDKVAKSLLTPAESIDDQKKKLTENFPMKDKYGTTIGISKVKETTIMSAINPVYFYLISRNLC